MKEKCVDKYSDKKIYEHNLKRDDRCRTVGVHFGPGNNMLSIYPLIKWQHILIYKY